MEAVATEHMLGSITTQLIVVQTDLIHFPISYYFRSTNERFELSAAMPWLLRLAQEDDGADCAPGVRLRASMLRGAIEGFSATIGERFWTCRRLRARRSSRPMLATTSTRRPNQRTLKP